VSGREIKRLESRIVAEATLEEVLADLINVSVTNDSLPESKQERLRNEGLAVPNRVPNCVSLTLDFITIGSLLKC
jgi:hypothetical protein